MAKVLTPSIIKIDKMVVAALKRKICPTQYAPDVANAAPEEEALRILNDCIAKLQGVTRHAGNT